MSVSLGMKMGVVLNGFECLFWLVFVNTFEEWNAKNLFVFFVKFEGVFIALLDLILHNRLYEFI